MPPKIKAVPKIKDPLKPKKPPGARFKSKEVFGARFNASKSKSQGHILNLLINRNIDGRGYVKAGTLEELWSYIYLLFKYNKDRPVFSEMKGKQVKGRAIAKKFISVVLAYTHQDKINTNTLISFINKVIKNTNPINPITAFMEVKFTQTALKLPEPTMKPNTKPTMKPTPNLKPKLTKIKEPVLDKEAISLQQEKFKKPQNVPKPPQNVPKPLQNVPKPLQNVPKPLQNASKSVQNIPKNNTYVDDFENTNVKNRQNSKKECDSLKIAVKAALGSIFTNTCTLKNIADIMDIKVDLPCDAIDVSKQKEAFLALPQETKENYIQLYNKTKSDIMYIKDILSSRVIDDSCLSYKTIYEESINNLKTHIATLKEIADSILYK